LWEDVHEVAVEADAGALPASGEPTWMTWLPSVMIPAELTSRQRKPGDRLAGIAQLAEPLPNPPAAGGAQGSRETLALSFDHRIVDGDLGSAMLRDIGAMLEDPLRMLPWS
jgi:hypothetical protein